MPEYISKSQNMRLVDVFILAPFMVHTGLRRSNLPGWIKAGMIAGGVLTMIYNGRNYIINLRSAQAGKLITETGLGRRISGIPMVMCTRPERSSDRSLASFE